MLNEKTKRYLPVIEYFCNRNPEFILVGGTALALQKKHRISVDFDLFKTGEFETQKFHDEFSKIHYEISGDMAGTPELRLVGMSEGQIHFLADEEVKVTLFNFQYPVSWKEKYEGIKLADLQSIFAMKLFAVIQRVDYKDFYDIAVLLQDFTLDQGLKFLGNMIKPEIIDTKLILNRLAEVRDLREGAEDTIFGAKIKREQVVDVIEEAIKNKINF